MPYRGKHQMSMFDDEGEVIEKLIDYPDYRKSIGVEENSTYKLSKLDRQIVGLMQVMGCWSNSSIGKAFGIDRGAVSKHGKRFRERNQEWCNE